MTVLGPLNPPNPSASQAVMIGTASYEHREPLPNVAENLTALAALLTSSTYWGIPDEQCTTILDADQPATVSQAVRTAAEMATADGALIVYYAGHGFAHPDNGDLLLAVPGTDPLHAEENSVHFEWIRKAVRQSKAQLRIVILDCCYAARAAGGSLSVTSDVEQLRLAAEIDGACMLLAADRNVEAVASDGDRHTAFTGALLEVLHDGVSNAGPTLDLRTVGNALRQRLAARQFPQPVIVDWNGGVTKPLIRNAAESYVDLAGAVVYAHPETQDPELSQAVILVLRSDVTGSLGVRINRHVETVVELPAHWENLAPVALDSGPVAKDGYIALIRLASNMPPPPQYQVVNGQVGTISLASPIEEADRLFNDLWVCVGYYGWGPGELEQYLTSRILMRAPNDVGQVLRIAADKSWSSLVDGYRDRQ